MSQTNPERYALNAGRERPPFTPRQIDCPSCGAKQSVKNESSQLVVCSYCGSHLETSREELKVLGKGPDQRWDFPIALGDPFRHKGQRYEVIARLALIEDGDTSELTRQYLLYNPRRGTMYLSEYKGHYDLTTTTHVMPMANPFTAGRGDVVKTYDGQEWVMQEAGQYELAYVDGALPWLAKVGDRHHYAEMSAKAGTGESYEVEARGDEIEYGVGRRIPLAQVQRAMGKADLEAPTEALEDAAETRKSYQLKLAVAAAVLALNLLLVLVCMNKGKVVLEQSFTPQELTTEVMSEPFRVEKDSSVVKVKTRAAVSNAWMALNLGFVEGDDKVIHMVEEDISYYHGVDGGESWSEGSKKATCYVEIPTAGTYHLLLQAVSAGGSATQAENCQHGVQVKVIAGAARHHFFVVVAVLAGIILIFTAARYSQWKKQEED